jgi:cell division septation protein DedD
VKAVGLVAVALLLAAVSPDRVSAQSDPRIKAAVQLAQNGRLDSARAVVRRLVATLSPRDSAYPEALYTQGMLATDPAATATSLQRVVVEYGSSPWAPQALVRLAQLYLVQGDPAAATQSAEQLRRDYPDSPAKVHGDFWGAQAYFNLKDESHGCALIQEALGGAGDDVEFKNQVSFYANRCGATAPATPAPVAATPTPTAAPPQAPTTDTAHPPAAAPAQGFSVQVLAVKSAAQVDAMLTRLKVMGFSARVVRDTSGLIKVRVGPYPPRTEAQRQQSLLKARLGGQPFVVEEP